MFEYFIDSPAFTPAVLVVYLDNIYVHNEYFMSRYVLKSNWALTQSRGALYSGIYFTEFRDVAKWRQKAIDVLNCEITNQVFPDEVQCELSLTYHKVSAIDFLYAYQMAEKNGYGSGGICKRFDIAGRKILDFHMPW